MATKTLAMWPRVGGVPLRFFAYKIRAREKVRKGEGEPGPWARDEASNIEKLGMGLGTRLG